MQRKLWPNCLICAAIVLALAGPVAAQSQAREAAVVAVAGWAAPTAALAVNTVISAGRVIGQPDFTHATGGTTAASLFAPTGATLDAGGNLYVADFANNRVLEYDAPLSNGMNASRVFGQPDFTHGDDNHGGLSATSLWGPSDVALDKQGHLYVLDGNNNRVLEYDQPLTTDVTADRVFGQPDFAHNTINNGGINAAGLYLPSNLALDTLGNLYVGDSLNNRVLEYVAPLNSGMAASRVFGQPDFTHNTANNSGLSANSLYGPRGVAVDEHGNLYVSDYNNNRVLKYASPLSTGMAASLVFGQPDFTHNTANSGGVSAASLDVPSQAAPDKQGNLYVADTANQRVLKYTAPLSNGMSASAVYGQPDFTSNTLNNGGLSSHSLQAPTGVALDAQGNLFVVDYGNHRVLGGYSQLVRRLWMPLVMR